MTTTLQKMAQAYAKEPCPGLGEYQAYLSGAELMRQAGINFLTKQAAMARENTYAYMTFADLEEIVKTLLLDEAEDEKENA